MNMALVMVLVDLLFYYHRQDNCIFRSNPVGLGYGLLSELISLCSLSLGRHIADKAQ